MKRKSENTVRVGAELDPDTDRALNKWSKDEGRSKRGHAAILLKRLARLRESAPDDLVRLGLLTPSISAR